MGMNFKPQTGLWKQCHVELIERNWLKELIPSPHPVGLVGVSFSMLAMATPSPWSWTKTQEAYVMFREWMGVLISVRPWVLGFLKPGDPAAPERALVTLSWFPLGCVAVSISLVQMPGLPRVGADRAWASNWNHAKALAKEKNGEAEAEGAWFRDFCVPGILLTPKRTHPDPHFSQSRVQLLPRVVWGPLGFCCYIHTWLWPLKEAFSFLGAIGILDLFWEPSHFVQIPLCWGNWSTFPTFPKSSSFLPGEPVTSNRKAREGTKKQTPQLAATESHTLAT